ncbi:DNA-binding transcriptional MerR regulator [Chryseomicrobium aureum]|nr:MerR family transcriptional regulator [Chryseomicrobium aureum]MBM7707767.1 DNA-binding transcriptional MerR regulator [Chryseomicrobium aureum]
MKIGEVARLSGLSTRTIDYYTNCGLLAFKRSEVNYRLYPGTVLQTLDRIQVLKNQRMTIPEIHRTLNTASLPETTELIEDVIDEFNCLQTKIIRLEEQLKDAPVHVKVQSSKILESKMVDLGTCVSNNSNYSLLFTSHAGKVPIYQDI